MLASLSSVLAWAEENGCAAAAFDTPNLELLLAAIGAAEHRGEPVIIQHAQLHEEETSIDVIGPIMVARAEASRVPVCVMLDHGEDMDYVRRALDLGFSAVMIDGSQLPYEENVALTLGAVELAREYGADVEAEIGFTTGHEGLENADDDRENVYTDPDEAARFVADTGIDALAASRGTAAAPRFQVARGSAHPLRRAARHARGQRPVVRGHAGGHPCRHPQDQLLQLHEQRGRARRRGAHRRRAPEVLPRPGQRGDRRHAGRRGSRHGHVQYGSVGLTAVGTSRRCGWLWHPIFARSRILAYQSTLRLCDPTNLGHRSQPR